MTAATIAYLASVSLKAIALAVIIGEPLHNRAKIWAVIMGYIARKGREENE